jgi:hypothetical protein
MGKGGRVKMSDSFTETIAKLKSEIEGHVVSMKAQPSWTQIEKLYRALGTIEELAETPRTSLVELFGIEDGTTGKNVASKQGEFYGYEPLDAAKRFLKRKGEAAPLDNILAALELGGVTANKDALRLSLSRSTWDVAKVGEDIYGLLEFYPHVKRGAKGKKTAVSVETTVAPTTTEVGSEEATGT